MPPDPEFAAVARRDRALNDVILIVEDNHTNALILHAMLRKKGYAAVVAKDGVEGVEQAVRLQPWLVLLDLHMPRLDGFAAAAEIRRRLERHPPVQVAVTANVAPEIHAACLAAGFAAVLPKPVFLDSLISTIECFSSLATTAEVPG
jgi:CheY-like chemotaxis protein